MAFDFTLPDLGEGTTEGEIVKWLVTEGERVEAHQVIVEVETDKAIVEVPAPRSGTVVEILKGAGEVVEVGETLVRIETDAEGEDAEDADEAALEEGGESKADDDDSVSVVGTLSKTEESLATPRVRALAKRLGVVVSALSGTGTGGRVTEADVKVAAGEGRAGSVKAESGERDAFGETTRVAVKGVRRATIKTLTGAARNPATVTVMDEADISELSKLRERQKEGALKKGVKLTWMPFFLKALQLALASDERLARLNASYDEETEEIVVKRYYNFGVAVQTPDGLMVPVVKGVDGTSVMDLAAELQSLGEKARERSLTIEEMRGNSFTLTNLGAFGSIYSTPLINPPDVAILAIGRIGERPVVMRDVGGGGVGEVAARTVLPLSLTFDHRVVDGFEAAMLLRSFIKYVEEPARVIAAGHCRRIR